QVERMRVALRAVADDADLLALDQREVGVLVVVDLHEIPPGSGKTKMGSVPILWLAAQNAVAAADAARAGAHGLDDRALVERLDESIELAAVAGKLDGVGVVGDGDYACAGDV